MKARLDEFMRLGRPSGDTQGLTSRDATENVEQLVVVAGLGLIEQPHRAACWQLAGAPPSSRPMSSSVAPTMCRSTDHGWEAFRPDRGGAARRPTRTCRRVRSAIRPRGIKGPVGSQQDQLDLLGSAETVVELERRVAEHLGIEHCPARRSGVSPVARLLGGCGLVQLASAPANFALDGSLDGRP